MSHGSFAPPPVTFETQDVNTFESVLGNGSGEDPQVVARRIAVEAKRLWREAQDAGLQDLAKLMEESFYRAYQQAGGSKAMRAV